MSFHWSFDWRRARAVARKEIFHIVRDPFTLALALGLPVLLVTVFGLAIEFNMRDIRLSVHDGDRSRASRTLTQSFRSSGYFVVAPRNNAAAALDDLDTERAKAALLIEPGFAADLGAGRTARAQLLLDGADNSTVGVILGYVNGIQRAATAGLTSSSGTAAAPGLATRFLFNPELDSQWFVIPGLIAVVTAILSVLLTALTVAREWENGSMELLLSTPLRPAEIVAGKLAPYTALGLAAVVFVYLVARLGFGLPFAGSHLVFGLGCLLFVSAYLAQGLMISVVTRRQQIAMQFAIVSGLLPSLLLSGFIFPIENMPPFFQYFTSILPAKWFMMVSRGTFLQGTGLLELGKPFLGLLALNTVLFTIATRKFKKDLEP